MDIREKIELGEFFCAPGIPDMISAVVAKKIGFDAVYASGYWMGASAYGLPDAGILTLTQMADRVSTLVDVVGDAAVIADADTGFGGLLNVRETVRLYEKAGAQIIQLEDQQFPKKCGHLEGKRVEDIDTMAAKIRVAKDAVECKSTLIIARTDSHQSEGISGVKKRLDCYINAGADIVFPEALKTEEEMYDICSSFEVPVMANMADGGITPILDANALSDLGFAFAIFPGTAALAAAAAVENVLNRLKMTGTSLHKDIELFDFAEFCQLIGFDDIRDFEDKWLRLKD
ncbi:MAG: oxaloacetate decarboxylase [Cellvibrionales bacterium TMED148]|nr:carboxyvinyl-carboxyphosphonate phosphorylmutase [Porticoccaceae bacterium]RPG92561.1 MAG: oxaloacetate decarboxylase [Cellvibrionales bacterium TMED148]